MYAYIKGTLEETGEDYIVVEAGGIEAPSCKFVGGRGKSLYLSACAGGCDDLIWFSHQG